MLKNRKKSHPDFSPDYPHQDQYLRFTAGSEAILLDLNEQPSHLVHSFGNIDCRFYHGHVVGEANSAAALSFCGQWQGLIERENGVHVLESVFDTDHHVLYKTGDDLDSPFGKFSIILEILYTLFVTRLFSGNFGVTFKKFPMNIFPKIWCHIFVSFFKF